MDLANLKPLSALNKLQLLRTTGGLTMLANALAQGHSLSQIAEMIGVTTKTMYRWQATYVEINDEIIPYTKAAYRIIYAYDDYHTHFKGCIMNTFANPEEMWSNIFIQQYFKTFNKSKDAYLSAYLKAMQIKGYYKLSNRYLLTFCTIDRQGFIKTIKTPF